MSKAEAKAQCLVLLLWQSSAFIIYWCRTRYKFISPFHPSSIIVVIAVIAFADNAVVVTASFSLDFRIFVFAQRFPYAPFVSLFQSCLLRQSWSMKHVLAAHTSLSSVHTWLIMNETINNRMITCGALISVSCRRLALPRAADFGSRIEWNFTYTRTHILRNFFHLTSAIRLWLNENAAISD